MEPELELDYFKNKDVEPDSSLHLCVKLELAPKQGFSRKKFEKKRDLNWANQRLTGLTTGLLIAFTCGTGTEDSS